MALGFNALNLTLITLELGYHLNLGILSPNNKNEREVKKQAFRFGKNFELDAVPETKTLIRLLSV